MTKTESKKTKFDLGSKNVRKTFLSILIPTLVAQVISGTFVIFDTFFVSHGFHPGGVFATVGTSDWTLFTQTPSYASLGPAAISYAAPYTFFIIGVGLAIGGGLSSIMTKQLANNDKTGAQRSINAYMPMTIMLGLIIMVFLLIFAKVLVWMGSGFQKDYLDAWFANPLMNKSWTVDPNAPITKDTYKFINGHLLSQAAWFLRIQALGAIPYVYMVSGVIMLRVQGKAQYATSFSSVGLVVNIILDFTFIMVLKMNVVGAAIATIIGQYATAAIYWWYFKYRAEIKATSLDFSYAKSKMKEAMVSGVSIMMLQVLSGMILILFTFSIGVTNYGEMQNVTNYTAVYQGYNAIFIFVNLIIIAIAQSMKPIIEFNYIRGDLDNVKKGRNWGYGTGMIFALIVTVIIVVFAGNIIGSFYNVKGNLDFITSGYYAKIDQHFVNVNCGKIFTDGMNVAQKITQILFITFPIATAIQISGTYIQSLGEDKRTSIMLFGKLAILFPLILFMGLVFPAAIEAKWQFFNSAAVDVREPVIGINTTADLGMFLSLPITDLIIGSLMVYYIIDAERKRIKPKKQELKEAKA